MFAKIAMGRGGLSFNMTLLKFHVFFFSGVMVNFR